MNKYLETDNAIIDSLGGTLKTANLCEVSAAAVAQWRSNGIPKARMMFLKLARPNVFPANDHQSIKKLRNGAGKALKANP